MATPSPPWDRLYNDIKLTMPGTTDAVIKQMLFQIVKDFTDKTNIWQETVPIAVKPDVFNYPLNVMDKGKANRLLLLYDPARADPDKKWVQSNVQMKRPDVISISFAPSTATTWMAIVAKTPTDPTTEERYPDLGGSSDWIIDKYRDALMFGVMGRLQMLPAKTFSDPKLGRWNWQQYITERGKARTDVLHANVYGGQRWTFPQDFATYSRKGWT